MEEVKDPRPDQVGVQPWRRLLHVGCGVALVVAHEVIGPGSLLLAITLAVATALGFLLDWLRLANRAVNRAVFKHLAWIVSPREADGIASSTWFLAGALSVLLIAPEHLFRPAMLVLALSDPAACIVGKMWGRRRLGSGTLLGTAAFLLAGLAVLTPLVGIPRAVIGAVAAAAVEVVPGGLDDNFSVPLATALVLWAAGAEP